jgi:putative transposase
MTIRLPIAALRRLPGMPEGHRGVEKRLKRIGARRIRRGLHEIEFAMIQKFPLAAQAELAKRFPSESSEDADGPMRAESGRLASADSVPAGQTGGAHRTLERADRKNLLRADSKTEIMFTFRTFREKAGGTLRAALRSFVALYNDGRIAKISEETRARYPHLAVPTLERDFRKLERGGPQALIRKDSERRGDSIIARTPGMADAIEAAISAKPHIRVTRIWEWLCTRYAKVPSLRALQNFGAQWKKENPALMERLRDPDNYKRHYSIALGDAAAGITRVNQLWEIDGTPADVMCFDGRWHLNCVVDVRSRKMCVLLTPTASADGTARLLVKAISAMGVSEAIKGDWGKEYQNKRIKRACLRLGFFTVDKVARPYSGELKPFVERGQGTILHNCLEQIDGYVGHSVAEAAEIRAQQSFQKRRGERRNLVKIYNVKLTAAELQDVLDRWLDAVYGNSPHAGLHGSTPNAEFAAGEARGEVRRVSDERQLDVLFGEDGVAAVGTKGLRIKGAQFWDDALIEWRGRKVQWIRTRDAGRVIVYSDEEKPQFVCIAEDYNAKGVDRQIVAIAAKQREKEHVREQLADLRRKRSEHRPERMLEEVIASAEARAAATLAPETSITAMPALSAGLREAAAALAALELKPSAPLEHLDRVEVDRQYEEIARADKGEGYDEEREAAMTMERWQGLINTPRAKWTDGDREFFELARALPEIRAFTMRRSA